MIKPAHILLAQYPDYEFLEGLKLGTDTIPYSYLPYLGKELSYVQKYPDVYNFLAKPEWIKHDPTISP